MKSMPGVYDASLLDADISQKACIESCLRHHGRLPLQCRKDKRRRHARWDRARRAAHYGAIMPRPRRRLTWLYRLFMPTEKRRARRHRADFSMTSKLLRMLRVDE